MEEACYTKILIFEVALIEFSPGKFDLEAYVLPNEVRFPYVFGANSTVILDLLMQSC